MSHRKHQSCARAGRRRHKVQDRLVNFVCDYVGCVSSNATGHRRERAGILQEAGDPYPTQKSLSSFFPDVDIQYAEVQRDVTAEQARVVVGGMYERGVRKFIMLLSSAITERAIVPIVSRYADALFINSSSTLPSLRTGSPKNLYYSLQSDDFFIPQVFGLSPGASTDAWLVSSSVPSPYQLNVQELARQAGVRVVTPDQLPDVADEIVRANIVYVNVPTEAQQLQTAGTLPLGIQASVVFIDIVPRTQKVVDTFPLSIFQIVTFCPGSGTAVTAQSAWSTANRPPWMAFPHTDVMSVYYYLSFIKRLHTFAERGVVVQKSVNYNFYIILNSRTSQQ